MLERLQPALRIVCLLLAGVLVLQLSRLAGRSRTTTTPADSLLASPLTTPTASVTTSTAAAPRTSSIPPSPAGPATNIPPTRPPVSGGAGPAGPPLPPAIQARVDRITQSEVLGPVPRPLPMALLGIAGRDAFVRAPDGQVGLLREGEELGGVKLLRIGTNRVLIEHEQQRKELMLFSGFGSEPLLSKETKDPK